MNEKSEALRLADALQQQAVWEGHYGPSYLRDLLPEAAAELRRLAAIEAQRDALLAALRPFVTIGSGFDMEDVRKARVAIKAEEEGK